jgi:hypothetical protein
MEYPTNKLGSKSTDDEIISDYINKVDQLNVPFVHTASFLRDSYNLSVGRVNAIARRLVDEKLISKVQSGRDRYELTTKARDIAKGKGYFIYLEEEKHRKNTIAQKDYYDARISEWQFKYRSLPFWLSGGSLVISILAFIKSCSS